MHFDFEEVKKHPYAIGGIVVAGTVFLYVILHRGQSSAAVSTGIDPTLAGLYQSEAATQAQQQQQSAQLQATQIAANTQGQANQLTAGVDLAQIKANASSTDLQTVSSLTLGQDQIAGQLGIANDQLTASTTASGNALLALLDTNKTQVDINAADQATNQYNITALADIANVSSNNNRDISISAIKAAGGGGGGGIWGAVGGIVGGAAAAFGV